MSVDIEFRVDITCAECGTALEATQKPNGDIAVSPCPDCIASATETGKKDGYDDGYDQGHSDGEDGK